MRQKLSILIIALSTFMGAKAADFQVDGLYYKITSNSELYTVEVTYQSYWSSGNYSGMTTATIPETVTYNEQAYSVTSIGNYAFAYCSGLTSVTIPNSVTSIGHGTFSGCSGLTSVTIPNSVTSIGNKAFENCSDLTSVTIPNSVTSIGYIAFYDCSGLTSVTFAENSQLTSIGESAFEGCSGLTSVTIPNSVTSIGNYAFEYCSGLTSVTIPNSVTSIGEYAFSGCTIATIYCQATERPSDWSFEWDYNCGTVVWGYVGIAEKVASNVKIYASHNTIVVENAEAEISVFDATGRCVAKRKATNDHIEVAMPRQGIYIVKVGAEAAKVVVGCL